MFKIYKKFLSPIIHRLSAISFSPLSACRYSPTCSQYTATAVAKYGIIHGSVLGLKRLLRCHPYSKTPHLDPVP